MADTTRWQRIDDIFHQAVQVSGGPARNGLLAELCAGDAALLTEVHQLVTEDDRLQEPTASHDRYIGLRLGNYEIDTLIARGGMGSVYQARRADAHFDQRVAIKIMDARLSDPVLLAQFRAERQILARLDHPNITRLLDGGVTPQGEPYLVMERIDGQRLDRYCNDHRLTVEQRVRLFLQVCGGVEFAHRNLILHRDLKPSNILVTKDGHAKLLDFGTAKLLQPERETTLTRAPLTPAYASPEQLTGEPVGTASDEYSLGLLLYELLCGVSAFRDRTSLIASVERALTNIEPTPPHHVVMQDAVALRGTTIGRLRKQLAGDLGTIVRKTLAHRPADRYGSVQRLADDLERYLTGRAIIGRPPSIRYHASRFVRRHWLPVSLAAALVLALSAATVVSLRQSTLAQVEAEKARRLNRFLSEMLSSANPNWTNANARTAGSITVRDVLEGAGRRVAADLGAMPEVEAEMRTTLARTYIGLGDGAAARAHLESTLAIYRAAATNSDWPSRKD